MKALILNSGLGKRLKKLTDKSPKCMLNINKNETILSHQLKLLKKNGINDVVITTGLYEEMLKSYCYSLQLDIDFTFIKNPDYAITNYIYSMYLASEYLDEDIIIMHGDLIFDEKVLQEIQAFPKSCMIVSSSVPLPQKDFKAVIKKEKDGVKILKIGIEYFDSALAAQPLFKLYKKDWNIWKEEIKIFCERGERNCYAEEAFNNISDKMILYGLDIKERLCSEVDTEEDLLIIRRKLKDYKMRVYLSFSTDILHGTHINLISKAAELGEVIVGVLSDEAVASYRQYPLLNYEERKNIIEHIQGVSKVVEQKELSYAVNLRKYKPDYVVHGDDWKEGFQKPIRDEVIKILQEYGGELIEYPYSYNEEYKLLEQKLRGQLSIPDIRRGRLRKLLNMKKTLSIIEAHSGITGLIAEHTTVLEDGKTYQFDGMWISSLCDSIAKGKPDIELIDISSRMRTIDDIMEVTTKPIILDGDTGGLVEHFVYTVRSLERVGVSAVIIEDKVGLKKNSLFGTEVKQQQASIEEFCAKITAGKKAQKTAEFMIIARIESLILNKGMEDALERAFAFVRAGADGIMIHSKKKEPDEIFEFIQRFRERDSITPLVVVPTTYNSVKEEEFSKLGVNIVIYANHLTRSSFPAMKQVAESILKNHRSLEADSICMPIKEIITLIPEE